MFVQINYITRFPIYILLNFNSNETLNVLVRASVDHSLCDNGLINLSFSVAYSAQSLLTPNLFVFVEPFNNCFYIIRQVELRLLYQLFRYTPIRFSNSSGDSTKSICIAAYIHDIAQAAFIRL